MRSHAVDCAGAPWLRRPAGLPLLAAVRSQGWLAAVPLLAALLWTLGFVGADPRAMGSFGLLSLFTAGHRARRCCCWSAASWPACTATSASGCWAST